MGAANIAEDIAFQFGMFKGCRGAPSKVDFSDGKGPSLSEHFGALGWPSTNSFLEFLVLFKNIATRCGANDS
jgi:hypothetical protein